MPRLTKIYTRTGDDGTTALGTKKRVLKDDFRVATYGEIDELNAVIGLALSSGLEPLTDTWLRRIQNELFNLGSQLAFPIEDDTTWNVPVIEKKHLDSMEANIDELLEIVGPLENFILPGGSRTSAELHLARTVCRRAERSLVALMGQEEVDVITLKYLNRLSDLLFVMARYENQLKNISEITWNTSA